MIGKCTRNCDNKACDGCDVFCRHYGAYHNYKNDHCLYFEGAAESLNGNKPSSEESK